MINKLTFTYGAYTLAFSINPTYPSSRSDEVTQVSDRTAANTLQVESLGLDISQRTYTWPLMTRVDYAKLLDWFYNKVNAMENWFTCIDTEGNSALVRFTTSRLSFTEIQNGWKGSINLEYAIVPGI